MAGSGAPFVSMAPSALPEERLYDLMVAVVSPRPVALISTVDADGKANLAPFSYFMLGGVNPPSVAFSVTNGPGGMKDTLRNAMEQGEFVVSTVHRAIAEGMNTTSFAFHEGEAEWEAAGFTMLPSEAVRPPRVAESLAQLECRVFRVVAHGEGVGSAHYVIGEVVRAHVVAPLWSEAGGIVAAPRLVARLGGPVYLDPDRLELFEMEGASAATEPPEER